MQKKANFLHVSSIQTRLGITFLVFLILLVVSVVVTFIGIEIQTHDARIINLAGRQRMLLQQMTSLALGFSREHERLDWYVDTLNDAMATFEETLSVMQEGGQIIDYTGDKLNLSRPASQDLSMELGGLRSVWGDYRRKIDELLSSTDASQNDAIVHAIEEQSSSIIEKADQVVRRYENITQRKLSSLRAYQLAFLCVGLVVLGVGWWITRKSVVSPLGELAAAARGIGEGHLEASIRVSGPDEVKTLGLTLDQMRLQVLSSQQSLLQWAQTLEDRVHQRTRELEALATVNGEITSHLAISDVLSSVAKKVRELSRADVVSLCLLDQEGKVLNLHAVDGLDDSVRQMSSSTEHPMVGRVLHKSCVHPCELQSCEGACQIIDKKFRASHLAVSVKSRDQVIGALCIGSQKANAFRPEIKTLLSQLAEVTAVALENSRLYLQAENLATMEERQRIASEMHDGSLQTLSFIKIMARWAKDQIIQGDSEKALSSLEQIERAEDQAEQEIRRAIASLEDDFPLNYTLQEQLTTMANEMSKGNIPVECQSEAMYPIVLDSHESEQALRIVREAITNAQKHSRSDRILVILCFDESIHQISLRVKDFGIGFDILESAKDGRVHFGMKIMQARAARLGGEVYIQSAVSTGTELIFSWRPSSLSYEPKES